jgi:gliding motility-associated-like protein
MKYVLVLFLFLSGHLLHAQTCTSSLGDPIVDITFGSGPDFGPQLANGITNLTYISNQCPEDGFYTIASSTNNCYGGTWLNINKDHTGNPNGYFMLINASFQPSDFYVQTVTGLCGATTYQFAAWILNLASETGQILPNITFNIENTDGTLLASVNSGNVPVTNPAQWNQYAAYFTTPAGVSSVILRMTNNAPGGIGNDLALDDITFRAAGPTMAVTTNGQTIDTATVCAGNTTSFQFSATVQSCYSSPVYQWEESTDNEVTWTDIPGATSLTYSAIPSTAGSYSYRLKSAQSGNIGISSCSVASTPITVIVLPIPIPAVSITASSIGICAGSPATFTAMPTDGGNTPYFQWLLNGMPVATAGSTYTGNTFANGDVISCVMTSDATCVINPVAFSNDISMTVTPIVVPSVQITASATIICSDSTVTFTALPSLGGDHPDYQWMVDNQPAGTDSPVYSAANLQDGDMISVTMTGSIYCSIPVTSNVIAMTVYPTPQITLTSDTIIGPGSRIGLNPIIVGQIISYQWTPATGLDNPAIADPEASPVITTTYQLKVATNDGCTASAKETVAVFYDLLMPNAFTPNGDGRNDVFRIPPSIPVTIIRFMVFNRWGGLVFSTASTSAGWDGRLDSKPQPAGTYVWMIEYYDPLTKKQAMKSGTVELIR